MFLSYSLVYNYKTSFVVENVNVDNIRIKWEFHNSDNSLYSITPRSFSIKKDDSISRTINIISDRPQASEDLKIRYSAYDILSNQLLLINGEKTFITSVRASEPTITLNVSPSKGN